ncbi:MAG: IPT/TIG domain-containing protein, partial [Sulfuricella sp.]|nr:IPT/TIG domain-containing protein [Sulfuricella sp.]
MNASHYQPLAQRGPRSLRRLLLPLFLLLATVAPLETPADTTDRTPAPAAQELQSIYGPKTYAAGSSVTDSFKLPAGVTPPCYLQIDNGRADGKGRVGDATITLNDRTLLSKKQFSGAVSYRTKVELSDTNRLRIEVPAAERDKTDNKGSPAQFSLGINCTPVLPRPTELSPDPLKLGAGTSGTLTARLAPTPVSGGVLNLSSSNERIAGVPASQAYRPGQSRIDIPVSAKSPGEARITASLNGRRADAAVRVKPARPASLASLLPGSLSLAPGAQGQLTATLSAPQAHKTEITLRIGEARDNERDDHDKGRGRDAPLISAPETVSVPPGQTRVSIPVTAGTRSGTTSLTARLDGSSATSQITVAATQPSVVALVPATQLLTLGSNATLTLTLSAAVAKDTLIPLSASPTGIVTHPASVTIPAGQSSTPIALTAVGFGQTSISAALNGGSAASLIQVIPVPARIAALEPATATLASGADGPFTVKLNAIQPDNTDIALSVDQATLLQIPASVTVPAGQTQATFSATGTNSGDVILSAALNGEQKTARIHISPQAAHLLPLTPNPLSLQQGATGSLGVGLDIVQENDTVIAIANSAPTIIDTPASLTVPAGQTQASLPVAALQAGNAQLSATLNGSSQSAAIEIQPPPPGVAGLDPALLKLPKGRPGVLRISLNRAPNTPASVALTSDTPTVATVPPGIVVPAGALGADLPVSSLAEGQSRIGASLNGTTASATVSVGPAEPIGLTLVPDSPNSWSNDSFSLSVTGIYSDGTSLDLTGQATFSSSDPNVATIGPDGSVATLAAGTTTLSAVVAYTDVQGQPARVAQTTQLTVKGAGTLVLSAPAATLAVGKTQTVTVTSPDPAGAGGLTVSLAITGGITAPASIQIPAGGLSATFTVTATAAGPATLKASAPGRYPGSLALTIAPALSLTAIAPPSVIADGQAKLLSLSGSGFVNGAQILAGGQTLPSVYQDAGHLSATLPGSLAAAPGSQLIQVVNPDGQKSNTLNLTLLSAAPQIVGLNPASGPVGSAVTLQGSQFSATPSGNDVRFNGERATVAAASATELKVIVPVKASSGPVSVTTAKGTGVSPIPYTVKSQQDFDLQLDPAAAQLPRGGAAGVRVKLASNGLADYGQAVTLSVTGLPAGIAWQANPPRLTNYTPATVTFSAGPAVAPGDYNVTLTGSGPLDQGSASRSKTVKLTVLPVDATSVSGLVLHADDDSPFVGARIRLNGQETTTDASGNYRIVNPGTAGDQVLLIDGHTNNSATTQYPSAIAMPVMINAGQDNRALTSYIQAVDVTKSTVIVPGQAVSVTNPDLPDYALNIPQGAVLMGWNGQPIDKVSVRTVAADKLPIKPLPPGVNAKTVYLYYFFREGGATPSQPIPVTMMNDMGALPGEKADLWYYDESITPDANSNQWRIMGQGTVSDDGKSIVSDPGVGIPKFCCGATTASPPPPPNPSGPPPNPPPSGPPGSDDGSDPSGTGSGGGPSGNSPPGGGDNAPSSPTSSPPGDPTRVPPADAPPPEQPAKPAPEQQPEPDPCSENPVIYGTGASLVMRGHVLGVNALLPANLGCRYNSLTDRIGPFGRGTYLNTEWQLSLSAAAMVLMSPQGHRWILAKGLDNVYRPNPGLPGVEGAEGTSNGTGTGSTSVIRFRDGSRYEFTVFGRGNQVLTAQIDPWGNRLTVQRNSGTIGAVGIAQSVTDSAGRVTRIEYNGALISRLTDTSGR